MSFKCAQCQNELDKASALVIARRDECPKCKADLHCCVNCKFYDEAAYNSCKEPQAERVVDKQRSNFCDYFAMRASSNSPSDDLEKPDYLKQLDSLFK